MMSAGKGLPALDGDEVAPSPRVRRGEGGVTPLDMIADGWTI